MLCNFSSIPFLDKFFKLIEIHFNIFINIIIYYLIIILYKYWLHERPGNLGNCHHEKTNVDQGKAKLTLVFEG